MNTTKNIHVGTKYVIHAKGGFSLCEKYQPLSLKPLPGIAKRNITDAVQIFFPASILNQHIQNDQVVLDNVIFSESIFQKSIFHMGNVEKNIENYKQNMNFSFGNLFPNSLFIHPCVVDTDFLYSSLSNPNHFFGNITINNISQTLSWISNKNIFQNREISSSSQHFLPGDLIFIENGILFSIKTNMKYDDGILSLLKKNMENTQCHLKNDFSSIFEPFHFSNDLLLYLD